MTQREGFAAFFGFLTAFNLWGLTLNLAVGSMSGLFFSTLSLLAVAWGVWFVFGGNNG